MSLRTVLTRLGATLAVALFAPAAPALAALPQQTAQADLAAPLPNPLVHGSASSENAGASVAAAHDLNGDGLADMLIGAPLADANGRTDSGTVYVVYGRSPLAARTSLGSLSAASGYRIDGAAAGDRLGSWVASAGDVDADGRDDIVIGAPLADPSGRVNAGAAYVITDTRRSTALDLAQLAAAGYRIDGSAADDRAGTWVAGGGDVDGDRRDDVVMTAPQADPRARPDAGAAYVVHGGGATDLAALGANGYRVDGAAAGDGLGAAAIVSDANGDGRDEVLVGAPKSDPGGRADAGSACLVPTLDDATNVDLGAGAAGFRVEGAAAGDALGAGVGTSPDVTGDGVPELLLGATGADQNARTNSGSLYVLSSRGLPTLTDLAIDSPAVRIDGAQAGGGIGVAASGGGDMNGDRRADLAVGDPRFDHGYRSDAGAAYVLYGGSLAGTIDLARPPSASTRAVGASSAENAGAMLAWLGDANGDGRDDLLVGAYRADYGRSNAGAGYLLLGFGAPSFAYQPAIDATARAAGDAARPSAIRRTGEATYAITPALPAGMALDPRSGAISGTPTSLLDAPSVHTITMSDYAGSATATVTVRIAPAPGACANERPAFSGAADVFTGSPGGDLIRAGGGNDTIDAREGDDCVSGEAGIDALIGGAGADRLAGGADDDALHGGEGNDSVFGEDAADAVFGDAGDDTVTGGRGADVLDGGDGNDSVGGDEGDDRVRGGAGADDLHGGEGVDDVDAGDGDDRAWGGLEDDTLDGGGGDDQIWAEAGADKLHGGDGTDLLSGGEGDDDVLGDAGDDELHGAAHNDTLRGGAGQDFAYGETGNDLVDGEQGNDQLFGGPGLDRLAGGGGDDRLLGEAQDDQIEGEAGDDVVDGGLGDDRLSGGAGDDVVVGGSGHDTVEESAGRDQIFTDSGDDKVTLTRGGATVESGAGHDVIVAFNGRRDTIVCGTGRDTAYVDRIDRVKGCEKRVHSKPRSAAKRKKPKGRNSGRSRR